MMSSPSLSSMSMKSPTPSPSFPDPSDPSSWYGDNLLNISILGASSCLLLSLLVKIRSDHRPIPGPTNLLSKLATVYHARIDLHCGADAFQFLHIQRSSFFLLALLTALPFNLLAGTQPLLDPFALTTISHVPKSSPLPAHLAISAMEDSIRTTSSPAPSDVALFTLIIHGVPKNLASDRAPLEDYFHHRSRASCRSTGGPPPGSRDCFRDLQRRVHLEEGGEGFLDRAEEAVDWTVFPGHGAPAREETVEGREGPTGFRHLLESFRTEQAPSQTPPRGCRVHATWLPSDRAAISTPIY